MKQNVGERLDGHLDSTEIQRLLRNLEDNYH
jgi:hypothetical protein